MRWICGKYDSRFKWTYKKGKKAYRQFGHFQTAMEYARRTGDGMAAIEHIRIQPWETWKPRLDK
jgi:hypothetical protein